MKIIAMFFYNNATLQKEEYTLLTLIDIIINDSRDFILCQTPNINYDNLIKQWSDLYKIKNEHPNISLRYLLHMGLKFKICYGGYIKFTLKYCHLEFYTNTLFISKDHPNKSTLFNKNTLKIFRNVIPYLTYKDKLALLSSNSNFYSVLYTLFRYEQDIKVINSCPDFQDSKFANSPIVKHYFDGTKYVLLNSFNGKRDIYLLCQSVSSYNVEIIKIDNNDYAKQEILFIDEWTNYFMTNNLIYQFKYSNKKPKVNKFKKEQNYEIRLIIVKCFPNSQSEFSIEYSYYYNSKCFVFTSNKCLFNINNKKGKLYLISDFSRKYSKFKRLIDSCKIRNYKLYYKFIDDIFFISLNSFYMLNILNKRNLNYFPTIRGVDCVKDIKLFFYIRNHLNVFLISKTSYDVEYTLNRYNANIATNQFLLSDPILNTIDYLTQSMEIGMNKELNPKEEIIPKESLYIKFNDKYLCYSYYNSTKLLYIKLICKEQVSITNEKIIQINYEKYISKVFDYNNYNLPKSTKSNFNCKNAQSEQLKQIKNNIITHLKPIILFNGNGDIVINLDCNFWFYRHQNENSKGEIIHKMRRIYIQTGISFEYHNYIFTKNIFIIWNESTFKIAVYNIIDDIKMANVTLDDLEEKEDCDISIDEPFFLFSYKNEYIYLICSYDRNNNSLQLINIFFDNENLNIAKCITEKYTIIVPNFLYEEMNEKIIYCNFINNKAYLILFTNSKIYINKYEPLSHSFTSIKIITHKQNAIFSIRCILNDTHYLLQTHIDNQCYLYNISQYIPK